MIKFSTMTQCVTPDMHNIYIIQKAAGPPRPTRAGSYRGDAGKGYYLSNLKIEL